MIDGHCENRYLDAALDVLVYSGDLSLIEVRPAGPHLWRNGLNQDLQSVHMDQEQIQLIQLISCGDPHVSQGGAMMVGSGLGIIAYAIMLAWQALLSHLGVWRSTLFVLICREFDEQVQGYLMVQCKRWDHFTVTVRQSWSMDVYGCLELQHGQ